MSESKSGKGLLIVVLLLLGGGGFILYPGVQWFRLEMAARDAISDNTLTRFPDSAKILGIPESVKNSGKKLGFTDLEVLIKMEERKVGPVVMWFAIVNIKSGSKEFQTENRVETNWQDEALDELRDGDCLVDRLHD